MKSVFQVLKKELRQYVFSPIAYIVAGVFHGILGFFFYNSIVGYSNRMMEMSGMGMPDAAVTPTTVIFRGLVISMGTIFVLLTPLITMRLVAEEKRGRTMEMLMTSPISLLAILMGKFLAAFTVYATVILSTIYMPIVLDIFSQVAWPHVLSAYLGLLMVGAAMISVGLFASTVTEKQVVAAVLSIGMLVMFWFVGGGIGAASMQVTTFLKDVSMFVPFENMTRGLIDLRDAAILLSYTAVMIFLAHRVLESERW